MPETANGLSATILATKTVWCVVWGQEGSDSWNILETGGRLALFPSRRDAEVDALEVRRIMPGYVGRVALAEVQAYGVKGVI